MKAYRLVYILNKKKDRENIDYKVDVKASEVTEEDIKETADYCISFIKRHYSGHSEEFNGVLNIFSFSKLSSGGYCSLKIVGKEGEFEAAILIIKDGHLPFYPIQLYGTEALDIDKIRSQSGIGSFLSSGLAGRLKASEIIKFEKASEFLKSKNDTSLRNMLDILFDTYEDKFEIKLYDKLENVINWLAAISMAFPVELAYNINFLLSYYDGDVAEGIVSIYEAGLMEIKEGERVESFTFNFTSGRTSRAVNQFRITRLIEMGYIISVETLNAFHKFQSKFSYKKIDNELEKCYKLFNFINFGLGKAEDDEVKGAIEFATAYGTQSVFEELSEGFQNILNKIEYKLTIEQIKTLSEFLYKTALKSREKIYLDRANDFYFRFLDEYIMEAKDIDEEDLMSFHEEIKKANSKYKDRIINHSINTVRLKQIGDYLEKELHPIQAKFYYRMILGDLLDIRYSLNRAKHIEGFNDFLNSAINSLLGESINYKPILEVIEKNTEYFTQITLMFYKKLIIEGYTIDFIRSFAECNENKSERMSKDIRMMIYELDESTKLLLDEFLCNLRKTDVRTEYFWKEINFETGEIPVYYTRFLSEGIKVYLNLLNETEITTEGPRLIKFISEKNISVDRETLKNIIKSYENTLSLFKPTEEEMDIIQSIEFIKNDNRIETLPDVSGLIVYARDLCKPGREVVPKLKEIIENCPDLRWLDGKYYPYLSWFLLNVLDYTETLEDHKTIIDNFCRSGEEEQFFVLYTEIIKNRCMDNKSSGYVKVLNFLLCYYFYLLPKYIYTGDEHLLESINQRIEGLLDEEYIRNINDLNKDLTYEFQKRGLSVPVLWLETYRRAKEERGSSLLKSVLKVFNRSK